MANPSPQLPHPANISTQWPKLSNFQTFVTPFPKLPSASPRSGGFFDIAKKTDRLVELERTSLEPGFWEKSEKAATVQKERSDLEKSLADFKKIETLAADAQAAIDLAQDGEKEFFAEAESNLKRLEEALSAQEFVCKMSGEFDRQAAILEINSGSGGTEAQDWAEMLYRMYVRWAQKKGFSVEEMDYQAGDGAGIKSATALITGPFAYGHLRSEQGVHRLVRISPFDSNARRHTSFASVAVTPDIEEDIEVEVNEADLRIDTYRSSGAGGQHVNKTDSAVRLTHIPTGIVVACQSERSQHKNRARAMKLLKAKIYESKAREQLDKMTEIKGERKQIAFGSQIRSYVMQPYQLVKDLRTDYETSAISAVLDGEIDGFIEAYLLSSENLG